MITENEAKDIQASVNKQKEAQGISSGGMFGRHNAVTAGLAGYQAYNFGIKSLDPTSLGVSFLLGGLNSWEPFKYDHIFAWMPETMAKDEKEAAKKMTAIVGKAFRGALTENGIKLTSSVPSVKHHFSMIGPNYYSDRITLAEKACQLSAPHDSYIATSVYIPDSDTIETPKWIHGGKSYVWGTLKTNPKVVIESHLLLSDECKKSIGKYSYIKIFTDMYKKLPDWVYVYVAGKDPRFIHNGKVYRFTD